ncbi:ATP-binding protein [Sphaerisporangium sp. TRM90804]|uniref:ATP-binding protein n=1 Tax=Sphaerisporangium sp. TRM90804 TaxID=3031113 RepID=UPI00244B8699|nr:ATP-binding protein [Sphaerisporangium sp. TRM90804]MDH2429601.1 ATP-binding protein [Sphaerisporangium sp. TRM90804]
MRAEQPAPKQAFHRTGVLGRGGLSAGHDAFRVVVTPLCPGSAARVARAAVRAALARTGTAPDDVGDAEIVVSELAANAERHANGPYELRIHWLGGVPAWCEMVDGGLDLGTIPAILALLHASASAPPMSLDENGRGLMLAHRLSRGHCCAYPTTLSDGGGMGKAVAFALPCPMR